MRHLFACTTHPTDLSPEDLWRNPVGSIRAFSHLANGNLDCLDDGPGRGKQQPPQHGTCPSPWCPSLWCPIVRWTLSYYGRVCLDRHPCRRGCTFSCSGGGCRRCGISTYPKRDGFIPPCRRGCGGIFFCNC